MGALTPASKPATPEMKIVEPILVGLTAPVTQLLLQAGIDTNKAPFTALWAVQSVLDAILADDIDVAFVVKHQSHQ